MSKCPSCDATLPRRLFWRLTGSFLCPACAAQLRRRARLGRSLPTWLLVVIPGGHVIGRLIRSHHIWAGIGLFVLLVGLICFAAPFLFEVRERSIP